MNEPKTTLTPEEIETLKANIKALDKYHDGIVSIYEVFAVIDNTFGGKKS